MYSKKSKEKLSGPAKAGSVLILPPGSTPKDALVAVCDGCGAQLWIEAEFKDKLNESNHRTFCSACLKVRQVLQ